MNHVVIRIVRGAHRLISTGPSSELLQSLRKPLRSMLWQTAVRRTDRRGFADRGVGISESFLAPKKIASHGGPRCLNFRLCGSTQGSLQKKSDSNSSQLGCGVCIMKVAGRPADKCSRQFGDLPAVLTVRNRQTAGRNPVGLVWWNALASNKKLPGRKFGQISESVPSPARCHRPIRAKRLTLKSGLNTLIRTLPACDSFGFVNFV